METSVAFMGQIRAIVYIRLVFECWWFLADFIYDKYLFTHWFLQISNIYFLLRACVVPVYLWPEFMFWWQVSSCISCSGQSGSWACDCPKMHRDIASNQSMWWCEYWLQVEALQHSASIAGAPQFATCCCRAQQFIWSQHRALQCQEKDAVWRIFTGRIHYDQ
jgi:hypothetical protein